MKRVLTIAALILTAGTATAAGEAKVPKVIACETFDEFRDANGATMGVCVAAKEGGKPRVVRSYVVTKVTNPATGKPQAILVGFQ